MNILVNSETISFALSYIIIKSIYSFRSEKHSNFAIVRQKNSDINQGINHYVRYTPARIFQLILPNTEQNLNNNLQWYYFCPLCEPFAWSITAIDCNIGNCNPLGLRNEWNNKLRLAFKSYIN